jgi:AcrR family transcriptional regulator
MHCYMRETSQKWYVRMSSQKSMRPNASARLPQRQRGRLRVAALMQAGASVFAEKGFDAATMTEVAARASAPIGSLYQFFPSKEALAAAILARYGELVESALRTIEERAPLLSTAALADSLLDLMIALKDERAAALALVAEGQGAFARSTELRDAMRRHIARILTVRASRLTPEEAEAMAVVVLLNMKAVAALNAEQGLEARSAALAELRHMTRLYLSNRLGSKGRGPAR